MKELKLSCGAVTVVDDEDYDALSRYAWYKGSGGYAVRDQYIDSKRAAVLLHRVVMQACEGLQVDHINGSKLDNRKKNLRLCTTSQNGCNRSAQKNNTSGRKGVSWDKKRSLWKAQIQIQSRHVDLGRFEDLDEAARAYDIASKEFHGAFGLHNNTDGAPVERRKRGLRKDNKSGLVGVRPNAAGMWESRCRRKRLGTFSTKLAAAVAYNIAALQAYGFDAYQNPVFSGDVL